MSHPYASIKETREIHASLQGYACSERQRCVRHLTHLEYSPKNSHVPGKQRRTFWSTELPQKSLGGGGAVFLVFSPFSHIHAPQSLFIKRFSGKIAYVT